MESVMMTAHKEISMRFMGISVALAILLSALAGFPWPLQQTWVGRIADSACGAGKHDPGAEGGPDLSDRDCTIACVRGGSKYVFVAGTAVFGIVNPDPVLLEKFAGERVTITGERKGDSIAIAKIER